jgi:hypothetical protein
MGTDKVAIAFALWVEAHKKCVECEKRLKEAIRVSRQMGTLHPQELDEECRRLKEEADRLLAAAEAEMKASGRKP